MALLAVSLLTAVLAKLPVQESGAVTPCYEHLATLRYPPLARQAQVLGDVTATFRIDSLGKAAEMELTGHPLLQPGAAGAIAATVFPQACSNHTLRYTIRFHLAFSDGEPVPADRTVRASSTDYDVFSFVPRITFACPAPDRKPSLPRRVWRALRH